MTWSSLVDSAELSGCRCLLLDDQVRLGWREVRLIPEPGVPHMLTTAPGGIGGHGDRARGSLGASESMLGVLWGLPAWMWRR
jgi:hypothetical protein